MKLLEGLLNKKMHLKSMSRINTAFAPSPPSSATTVSERGLSVGIAASIQAHGSLANWHPCLRNHPNKEGFAVVDL